MKNKKKERVMPIVTIPFYLLSGVVGSLTAWVPPFVSVILFSLLAAGLVWMLFFASSKPSRPAALCLSAFYVAYYLIHFLSGSTRVATVLSFLLGCCMLAFFAYAEARWTTGIFHPVFSVTALLLFLDMWKVVRGCRFTTDFFDRRFWYLSLLIAAVLWVLVYALRSMASTPLSAGEKRARQRAKKDKEHSRFTVLFKLIAAALLVVAVYHSLVVLNYALDTSTPQLQTASVVDKDYSRGGRRRRRYWAIEVMLDGKETRFYVSSSEYDRYRVGDAFPVYRYEGGLGEPYYN